MNETIINQAALTIARKFKPEKIIMFGSQAKGTADDRSDLDLLVICNISGKRRTLATEIDRSLRGLGIARDIVILTPEEYEKNKHIPGTIARPAYLQGIILYEKQ